MTGPLPMRTASRLLLALALCAVAWLGAGGSWDGNRAWLAVARADEDWRQFCKVRLLPPTKAGSLMADLNGQYLLRQFYCPSCAVLLDTDFVEEHSNDAGRA